MAALDDLINQISDVSLREQIRLEVKRLNQNKKFGLVFEEHLEDVVPLYDIPVKRGSIVAKRDGQLKDKYYVEKIDGNQATCFNKVTKECVVLPVDALVCVSQLGEPIYPYLKPVDSVCNAPDSDLWHTLIEADNYHALQLLNYLYAGKVDCIYIDPPYNTGAKDWKYNNDYVDGSDAYRHSKWLSFMEKRLKLAKKLLRPTGVLIIAIDDYEVARLIQLTEDIFPEYEVDSVIINHHPQGGAADNISRTHEYALFVVPRGKKIIKGNKSENIEERWSLTRGGTDIRNLRVGRPNSFYAIYVEKETLKVKGVGPYLDADTKYNREEAPKGCIALYPIGQDGTERVWRYGRESMMQHIEDGDIICTEKMSLNVIKHRKVKFDPVFSVWTDGKYNAGTFGTSMLQGLFGGSTRFSYPKSLYTVTDCIRFSIQNIPNALILDFFAGSGTTLHAVNLLNAEDGGHRRCIMVTNNDVSDAEAKSLTRQGYRPGDEEWEKWGIARYVTWPRTVCSIEGHDVNGNPLKGNYLGSDIPMADGFKANAIYFKLGFLDKNAVELGRQFKELLSVLWMKAGSYGKCPTFDDATELPAMLILPENHFAVLTEESQYEAFMSKVNSEESITTVYIVTDSESGYRGMISGLHITNTYQLYRDYLDNFRIKQGRY